MVTLISEKGNHVNGNFNKMILKQLSTDPTSTLFAYDLV